jgi:hypothetical protein
MQLNSGLHLAYCTNVHRAESWAETFDALQRYTLAVRDRVCPRAPYGIGLRLSNRAAHELSEHERFLEFQRWLGRNNCYVFTFNGFAYGPSRGLLNKEYAYSPDWSKPERLEYTNLLFDLLSNLLPVGVAGSVSTLPGSFKGFHPQPDEMKQIRANVWRCVEHIARVSEQTGRQLSLGLEPEPLCLLESSAETLHAFDRLRAEHPRDERLARHLGVNYDTCHFAVEFEEPQNALACLVHHGIKICKIHLSSALKISPTPAARAELKQFTDGAYLHQVVVRDAAGGRKIFHDIGEALALEPAEAEPQSEWRVHLPVPMYAPPAPPFDHTNEHLLGVLDLLATAPELCPHLEIETDTWNVLPPELQSRPVVEQIAAECDWTLARLKERGLC